MSTAGRTCLPLLVAAGLIAAGGAAPARPAQPPAPGLHLAPCRIEHPAGLAAVSAECGTLRVPEDPAAPEGKGRQIELYVARVPAISRRKRPDPLFVLAGGPGMAATTFYSTAAPAFARIRRERDIVLVDQRGTGRSNGLHCELDADVLWRATEAVIAAETERCLTALATRAAVPAYTTSLAVQDLDRVRGALGYERINLYGVSYGTRVAQHYVRRFAARTRSAILDGVVPPEAVLGPEMALHAEAALERILARCAAQDPCRERFGDPADAYRALRERLARAPVAVELPHPSSGQPWALRFTSLHLASVLRLASYTSEQAALLPLTLDLAHRERNFVPLAAQFLLTSRALEEIIAYGMHNTVVCTEDVPFYSIGPAERARLQRTYLGTTQIDALENLCSVWPRGPMDEDLHAPLDSAVPALLLSGGDDPVTPPEFGERARTGFHDAVHLVLEGHGHGQLGAPCVDRVMARFIERGTSAGLDTACIARARPTPFFLSLTGPAP